ncbi:MAG: nitroreductase family protein [Anaerolineae bacterium]
MSDHSPILAFEGEPVSTLILRRYSCRSYASRPIAEATQQKLRDFIGSHTAGPFGTQVRMALLASTQEDRYALDNLGTYGFIRGATGFIAGAVPEAAELALEDFGYVMEIVVLYATSLGLGTVWLGGTFMRSRFAQAVALREGEQLPAVVAIGYPAESPRGLDTVIRRQAKSDRRLPWDQLFFEAAEGGLFETPLDRESAGPYATVLDMVRQAPSASNKQPWRIVRDASRWHLFLCRTWGYAARNALIGIADMQRIDMGIAMSHFALAAAELGLEGRWERRAPEVEMPDGQTSYVVTWVDSDS